MVSGYVTGKWANSWTNQPGPGAPTRTNEALGVIFCHITGKSSSVKNFPVPENFRGTTLHVSDIQLK